MFVFIGVFAAIVQGGVVHRITARVGEWPVLRAGLWMTAAALVMLGFTTQLWALFPVLVLLALGSGLTFPTVNAIVSQRAPADDQGGILGVMASAGGLARLIAPIAATALFQEVGVGSPLFTGGMLFVACGLIAAMPMARRPAVAA